MIAPATKYALIVDDEKSLREVIGAMLVSMGYEIIEAENHIEGASKAIDHSAKGFPLNLALVDLTIKGGDFCDTLNTVLKSFFPKVAIVAISGYTEHPAILAPLEHGFDGAIAKPFRKSELKEVIDSLSDFV